MVYEKTFNVYKIAIVFTKYILYYIYMDNILDKAIKILIATIICISLTIALLFITPINVHASNDSVLWTNNFPTCTSSYNNSNYVWITVEDTSLEYYCFYSTQDKRYFLVTDTQFKAYYAFNTSSTNPPTFSSFTNASLYSDTDLYYYGIQQYAGDRDTSLIDYPVYANQAEGMSAIQEYIENNQAWSGPVTVTVEAGCVAYMLVDGGRADLTCIFPELSNLLSRPLWKSTATYFYSNNLPSSGLYYNSQSGTLIDWLKAAEGDTNLAQQTHMGGRPLTDLPSGQFLVVYNPFYRGFDSNGSGIMSPSITVKLTNCGAVRQYKLTASYSNGDIVSTSDDDFQSFYQAIDEEELGSGIPNYTYYSASGTTSSAITVGSGNNIVTVENEEQTIGGFIQKILNIFSAPITYIRQLYNSAITFFSSLSLFWTWLPEPIYNIIISAVIVLVVIGVIKWLWK